MNENDLKNETTRLPAQARDMVSFVQKGITAAVQAGLDDRAILETTHDYICYWLHADDLRDSDEPLPITNPRLN